MKSKKTKEKQKEKEESEGNWKSTKNWIRNSALIIHYVNYFNLSIFIIFPPADSRAGEQGDGNQSSKFRIIIRIVININKFDNVPNFLHAAMPRCDLNMIDECFHSLTFCVLAFSPSPHTASYFLLSLSFANPLFLSSFDRFFPDNWHFLSFFFFGWVIASGTTNKRAALVAPNPIRFFCPFLPLSVRFPFCPGKLCPVQELSE